MFGHGGTTAGFTSNFHGNTANGRGLVLMTNASGRAMQQPIGNAVGLLSEWAETLP